LTGSVFAARSRPRPTILPLGNQDYKGILKDINVRVIHIKGAMFRYYHRVDSGEEGEGHLD